MKKHFERMNFTRENVVHLFSIDIGKKI